MRRSIGFTLIELLIVVAIIAILAAIAVPNFLEAQTRAKVSRIKSDVRSLITGIEAYRIDHNIYPISTSGSAQRRGFPEQINGIFVSGTVWVDLSTPVAYLTNAFLLDVFNNQNLNMTPDEVLFTYQNLQNNYCGTLLPSEPRFSDSFCTPAIDFYGAYRIASVGPDMDFFNGGISPQMPYDATNGTVSIGNIWRGQNFAEDTYPDAGLAMSLGLP